MSEDLEKLVKGLTKSQKSAILDCPGNPDFCRGRVSTMKVLRNLGIVADYNHWSAQSKRTGKLTSLGWDVRHLLKGPTHD